MLLLLLILMVCWNLLRVLQLIHRLLKNNLDAIKKTRLQKQTIVKRYTQIIVKQNISVFCYFKINLLFRFRFRFFEIKSNNNNKKLADRNNNKSIIYYSDSIQSFIRRKICFFISSKINFTSTKKKERERKKGV